MSYLDKFTQALVAAIGFNDGANRGFWRVQWRDRAGRWAEMGRGVLSKVRMPNGEVMDMRGVFIGGSDRPGFGRVLVKGQSEKGISDGVYEIGSNNGEIFQAKLTDETLKRAGIEDTDETTTQERLDSDIPNLADIVTAPITAEDEKLATDTPDDAQKAIIEEERAKSPLAKLPAGEEGRMSSEDLKAVLEGKEPSTSAKRPFLDPMSGKIVTPEGSYMPPRRQYGGEWQEKGQVYENGKWRDATAEEDKANGYDQVKAVRPNFTPGRGEKLVLDLTPEQSARLAVRKAFDDASFGEPVDLDEVLNYASKAPTNTIPQRPRGMKINAKPMSMQPGDIFDGKNGEEYEFESLGERDRVTRTQMVTAKNRKTGKSEQVLLDTDVTTPILRPDKNQPTPKPEPTPAPATPKTPEAPKAPEAAPTAPATPKTPKAAPEGVAKKKESTKVVPELPRAPKAEERPLEKARNEGRADSGQMVSLPAKTEQELFKTKLRPLIDEEGNPLNFYNVETGKIEPASNADAIEAQLLKDYPDAPINDNGQMIVERKDLEGITGEAKIMETFVERTQGNAFYVGVTLTDKATGESKSYYHYDLRDTYSSIHGKTNGIHRMSRTVSGEESPLQKGTNDDNYYFAPGSSADRRLAYFRQKHASTATEEKLIQALRTAKGKGVPADIKKATRNLEMFRVDFGGDVAKFREYDTIQNMRMLTLEEISQRYSDGRAATANMSPDQIGRIQKSQVDGVFDSMKSGDIADSTLRLQELAGRMPMLSRNQLVGQVIIDTLTKGIKTRLPKENKRAVNTLVNNAFATLQDSQTTESQAGAPHMSWDGVVLKKGYLVEYYNNDDSTSIGMVTGLKPVALGKYTDKVFARFLNSDGSYTPPIELSSAKMKTLDTTGDSPEARSRMTKYTPDIGGLELVQKRAGKRAVKTKIALLNSRKSDPNALDGEDENPDLETPNLGSEGQEGGSGESDLPPGHKLAGDMVAGDVLYSKDGEVLGQIVSVKQVKSKSGKEAFAVLYMDKNGDVKKPEILQLGESRGPKA